MAIIPGASGTSTKAVDGLEGPTSGAPVVFPSGFQGSAIPASLADSNITLTNTSNTVMVMTPTATRTITLPSTGVPANYSITVINRSASFQILVNSSGGNLVATVGLGQVTVLSTQVSPTTAAHWSLSTNGAVLQGGNSFGANLLVGTNDNFGIDFETNGTVRFNIGATGNVGIGTASPNRSASAYRALTVEDNTAAGDSFATIELVGNRDANSEVTGKVAFMNLNTTTRFNAVIESSRNGSGGTNGGQLSFQVADTSNALIEALFINDTGAVTIGTGTGTLSSGTQTQTFFGRNFNFCNDSGASNNLIFNLYQANTLRAQIGVSSLVNNIVPNTPIGALSISGTGISFSGDTSTTNHGSLSTAGAWTLGLVTPASTLSHKINGFRADADDEGACHIRNFSTAVDANGLLSPVLTVSKNANNTTTSNVLVLFRINGSVKSGGIGANGANAATFISPSDSRLKENIENIPSQLENILSLRPVEFDYIESAGGGHQVGFIAQEMQSVYPDSVGSYDEGMLAIGGWDKTSARLVKAIQELNAKVEAQALRIEELENA